MSGILICDQIQNSANTLLINSGAIAANTIGTSQLQSGISVAASALTVGGTSIGAGDASIMKNRIINGAMVIDQRNAGASGTANGYTVDRWQYFGAQSSKGTWQQNAGSVTPPVGFNNYLGFTSSSAYSVTSSDTFQFAQYIEGYNAADLQWGTANAKTVNLSFWVRSSLTGTFGGALINSAGNRSYPFSYTISSANTWTQASVTIAGDTAGTWLTTNGVGIQVNFGIGVGSTYAGTAGSWASANYYSATGATSVVGTSGATFYITGVQLEVGSSATGFEYVNYQTSLANCQRYYEELCFNADLSGTFIITGGAWSTTQAEGTLRFSVVKRTAATMGYSSTIQITKMGGGTVTGCTPAFGTPTQYACLLYTTGASGLTVGQTLRINTDTSTTKINASAEL